MITFEPSPFHPNPLLSNTHAQTALATLLPRTIAEPGWEACGRWREFTLADGDRLLLYYAGWISGARAPMFYATVGLAESTDGGKTFQRLFRAPVMDRSELDPWMVNAPCVRREGDGYRMWYASGLRWEEEGGSLISYYHLKIAHSDDGVRWRREGQVAVDLAPGERTLTRPCVIHEDGRYQMWFGVNGEAGQHLGYASSADGLTWERDDARVQLPRQAFDDRAQAFPWVHQGPRGLVLLYNGNHYGRDGLGVALAGP